MSLPNRPLCRLPWRGAECGAGELGYADAEVQHQSANPDPRLRPASPLSQGDRI